MCREKKKKKTWKTTTQTDNDDDDGDENKYKSFHTCSINLMLTAQTYNAQAQTYIILCVVFASFAISFATLSATFLRVFDCTGQRKQSPAAVCSQTHETRFAALLHVPVGRPLSHSLLFNRESAFGITKSYGRFRSRFVWRHADFQSAKQPHTNTQILLLYIYYY